MKIFKFAPLSIWHDTQLRRRLAWYYDVMRELKPAKYLICKSIDSKLDFKNSTMEQLWKEHDRLAKIFHSNLLEIKSKDQAEIPQEQNNNFLDLKAEIAKRSLDSCNFCEWECNVDRNHGKIGVCRLDSTTRVASWFRHFGEEPPLVGTNGSGTIFFTGCMFRCVFCQNWNISQFPLAGKIVDGIGLARIMRDLYKQGAHNINFVGGEPTPNIHTIIEGMVHLDSNIPMLWNSDMYGTVDAMKLLAEIIDIWLPDFKYGNDECARKLSNVPNYLKIISRNHKIAYENGDMIIRHLILPNHIECCTKPVLDWIAKNCPNSLVNVMGQYRPDYKVTEYPDQYKEIARTINEEELTEAYKYAEKLCLEFRQVS
jgi:putative pyruvate formate lyase activating enzyme